MVLAKSPHVVIQGRKSVNNTIQTSVFPAYHCASNEVFSVKSTDVGTETFVSHAIFAQNIFVFSIQTSIQLEKFLFNQKRIIFHFIEILHQLDKNDPLSSKVCYFSLSFENSQKITISFTQRYFALSKICIINTLVIIFCHFFY